MILSLLLVVCTAYLDTDGNVRMPVGQFRRALAIIVDDSLCNEQIKLMTAQSRVQDSAYRELRIAYDGLQTAGNTKDYALAVCDSARRDAVKTAERINNQATLYRMTTYVASGLAGILAVIVVALAGH